MHEIRELYEIDKPYYVYDILHDMNVNYLIKLLHNMLAETCLMLCFVFKSYATNFFVHEKSWAPVLK